MPKVDAAELASGLIIIAIGGFFFFGANDYRMGTITRMGPGLVPRWLGMTGMFLGAVVILGAFGRTGTLPRVAWRPLLAVLCAVAAFAVMLRPLGLIPTIMVTTGIAMLGNPKATILSIGMTAVIVAALCWVIFIEALALPMRPFWIGL